MMRMTRYLLKDLNDIYKLFSWKEMNIVMQICHELRKNGNEKISNLIFKNSVYSIVDKTPELFLQQ